MRIRREQPAYEGRGRWACGAPVCCVCGGRPAKRARRRRGVSAGPGKKRGWWLGVRRGADGTRCGYNLHPLRACPKAAEEEGSRRRSCTKWARGGGVYSLPVLGSAGWAGGHVGEWGRCGRYCGAQALRSGRRRRVGARFGAASAGGRQGALRLRNCVVVGGGVTTCRASEDRPPGLDGIRQRGRPRMHRGRVSCRLLGLATRACPCSAVSGGVAAAGGAGAPWDRSGRGAAGRGGTPARRDEGRAVRRGCQKGKVVGGGGKVGGRQSGSA